MDTKPLQVPSVARNVHYVAYGTPKGEFPQMAHRAAIITEVYGPTDSIDGVTLVFDERGVCTNVGLCVLNPTGQFFNRGVPFDPTATKPGTWHWPEYVPEK